MLQGRDYEEHQAFQQILHRFSTAISQNVADSAGLQLQFSELQQFFQLRVASLELAALNSVDASRVQAIHTEINKQLRLLGMDVMFLQAARQPLTAQKRQVQMRDRLHLLLRYCDTLLHEDQPEPGESR